MAGLLVSYHTTAVLPGGARVKSLLDIFIAFGDL